MKVLITGGAGFIGSHTADRLVDMGNEVLLIDNFVTGTSTNISNFSPSSLVNSTITDFNEFEKVFNYFQPEIVIHAAASYKDPDDWSNDAKSNIIGTINTAILSKKYKVKKLIYLQTSLCYGLNPSENPITIEYPISGDGSSYAISKTAAERYLELIDINYISFRLANVYGPRNLTGPLPKFYTLIKNGAPCTIVNSRRDFIFVSDVVNILIESISKDKVGNYNICTGSDITIGELFEYIKKEMGIKNYPVVYQEIQNDDVKQLLLDPKKTFAHFEWRPITGIPEGITKTIKWYKSNSILNTYTHLKAFK